MAFKHNYLDCYVQFENNILKIGNSMIERVWGLNKPIPSVISMTNKRTKKEWFNLDKESTWIPFLNGKATFYKSALPIDEMPEISFSADIDDDLGVAERHMVINVKFFYKLISIKWIFMVYPNVPILRTKIHCELSDSIEITDSFEITNDLDKLLPIENLGKETIKADDYLDYFPLSEKHCIWKSTIILDSSDYHNNLVKTEEGLFYPGETIELKGNLLFIKEIASNNGIILIKEGPTHLAYQGESSNDFIIQGNHVFSSGWGFSVAELNKHKSLYTYGSTVVLWDGEEFQALEKLQGYHRAVHKFDSERDANIISNTWGDRSRDSKICEEFIIKELSIAEEIGIKCCEIDDGWQQGATSNSINPDGVWEGYYKKRSDFWQVNVKRFPFGFDNIAEYAAKKGIRLALWFSPDSTDDFANWEKDSSTLIRLHNQFGVSAFKLDGIKIRSKKGEENLFGMMKRVVEKTNGNVCFNLDVTAEVRNGYYGRIQYAQIFLENRYTDWSNYYPHWTLRNLWSISKYYPSWKLQIEFLNVKRNIDKYTNDFLAPAECGIEYAVAVTMMANPLAFMELTGLDKESVLILKNIIGIYRRYQTDMLSGLVLPIGEEPSGVGWTGFQSITGKEEGYIIIYKEHNSFKEHIFRLWDIKDKKIFMERLIGCGKDRTGFVDSQGSLEFKMEGKFQYCLYKYTILN